MINNQYGSLDIGYTYPIQNGTNVLLETDVLAIPAYGGDINDEHLPIGIRVSTKTVGGIYYLVISTEIDGVENDKSDYCLDTADEVPLAIRIFLSNSHVSVYVNNKWVYINMFKSISYPEPITATLSFHGGTGTLTDIWRSEIPDEREALYVDYEASAASAIQSIVQQRPLEILPDVDRKMLFTYVAMGDQVENVLVIRYTETVTSPSDLAADGIVQGIGVGISTSELTASEVGFVTRLFRLSELFSGAFTAAAKQQLKAIQRRNMINLGTRCDPRVMLRDRIILDYVASGTQRAIKDDVIVEALTINISEGNYSMNATCRRKKDA